VRFFSFRGMITLHESQPQEDMRRNQHLITNDVVRYMAEYEVSYALFCVRRQELRLLTTAGQRGGPRRDRPTRAVVGGLVFCLGSGWRVRYPRPHITFFPSDEIPVRLG
jgi:hypothetical protein